MRERVRRPDVGGALPVAGRAVERHALLDVVDARDDLAAAGGVLRREVHGDRTGVRAARARRRRVERDRRGRRRGLLVDLEGDLDDLHARGRVGVVAAAADGIAAHVERAVVAELRADDQAVLLRRGGTGVVVRQPVVHAQHLVVVLAHPDFLPEAVVGAAVVDEPGAVVVRREGARADRGRVVAVDRARHRLHAAGGEVAEVQRVLLARLALPVSGVLLPDRRLLGLGDRVQAVEGRLDRASGPPARSGCRTGSCPSSSRTSGRSVAAVAVVPAHHAVGRRVVAHAERPTLVARLVDQVPLDDARRAAAGVVRRTRRARTRRRRRCPGSSGRCAA